MTLPRRILLSFTVLSLLLLVMPNVLGGLALQRHFYLLAEQEARELARQLQKKLTVLSERQPESTVDLAHPELLADLYQFATDYLLFKEGLQMETGFFLLLNSLNGNTLLITPNLEGMKMPEAPMDTVQEGQMSGLQQPIPVMLYRRLLYQGDTPVADLQIAVSMLEYQYVLQRLWRFWLLGCLVALAATFLLGFFLYRQILSPLVRLTQQIEAMMDLKPVKYLQVEDLPPDQIRRLAQSFNTLLAQLTATLERQQRFVSDASHELRSPLTAIQGHAELLIKRAQTNPEILREGLDVIRRESGRLGKLVEDMLLLARLSHYQPKQERLDLALLSQDVVESRRLLHPNLAFSGQPGAWMAGEQNSMRRILLNLIDNALRYTPPQTAIQISVWQEAEAVVVQVADQGPGIPAQEVPHVFERFYRIEADRNREQGGSGLGLPIVKELVDWQQGHLELQTSPEQGTIFTIRFPKA